MIDKAFTNPCNVMREPVSAGVSTRMASSSPTLAEEVHPIAVSLILTFSNCLLKRKGAVQIHSYISSSMLGVENRTGGVLPIHFEKE